jgi:hypothetical protein
MKIDKLTQDKTAIEVSVKKQQKHELKLIGSLLPKRGHQIFEINTKTGKCRLAEYRIEKEVSISDALLKNRKSIVINKDCEYISSLNAKSAMKRFNQGKGSSIVGL